MAVSGKIYLGVLLDADNTLFDFRRAERQALQETLEQAFEGPVAAEVIAAYLRINERLWKELEQGRIDQATLKIERFRLLLEQMKLRGDPRAIAATYVERLGRQGILLPHAREVLEELAARLPLALLTNGISAVQRGRIERSGIGGFFRAVVISEEVGLAKPDPRIFRLAVDGMGLSAGEVLCVGDSPASDIRGGRLAGLDTCWVRTPGEEYPPGEPPPDYRIDDLRELPRLVGGEIIPPG